MPKQPNPRLRNPERVPMNSMRRVAADRLGPLDRPRLLGRSENAVDGTVSIVPDPAEELRIQRQHVFDATREEGFAEGMRDAQAEIQRQIEVVAMRLREEHAGSLKRLRAEHEQIRKLAASLPEALAAHATDAETLAVEVAFAAVTRLLGEKSADGTLMRTLCQRIVHEYGHPPATLRVSEADLPLLEGAALGIALEADRRLAPGQCVIDTVRGQFESGLDVRLDALRKALLATVAEHRGQA